MSMRDTGWKEQDESSRPPPLPPSPLTQVVEAPPFERLRLPWMTVLFASAAGPLAAILVAVPFIFVDPDTVWLVALVAAVLAGARCLTASTGVVAADRAVPSWPRIARWGVGMAVIGLIPGLEIMARVVPGWHWQAILPWIGWIVGAAIRDGIIGALTGWALRREGGVWRAVISTAAVWGVYALCDLSLSGLLARVSIGTERVQFALTLALAGCLLPVALGVSLRLAWRRALLEGTAESQ